MKTLEKIIVSCSSKIKDVIDIIDKSSLQIALVLDETGKLFGTITDGDVRRGLLSGFGLESEASEICNKKPVTVLENTSKMKIYDLMDRHSISHIPVVNAEGQVVDLEVLKAFFKKDYFDNPVVLMAGGLGSRLRPLTNDCPKPLLKIGGKPILEIILEKFCEEGFRNFYISVNYKSDMIRDFFGYGDKYGVNIQYLVEEKRLGTAGGLSLLPGDFNSPFIVMNGDLLTKVNFKQLLNFHLENSSDATMCVREYEMSIPYGVIKTKEENLVDIEEKPSRKFFVNAGIYVLNKELLGMIPKDSFYDMTDLFQLLINKKYKTSAFPLKEYWLDIGRLNDFETANFEYGRIFSK
jgi:dTDP-glucose pyrophosphorylase